MPEPEHVVSTASIGAMGDLLMHMPIFDDHSKYNAAVQQKDGSYDFSTVFQYLSEYTSELDFTVANLETTLAAEDNGYSYSGYYTDIGDYVIINDGADDWFMEYKDQLSDIITYMNFTVQ